MKQINLTQGKVALVDDEDYGWLSQWTWRVNNSRGILYAVRYLKKGEEGWKNGHGVVIMHRAILEKHGYNIAGKEVDHINGDSLDNRKSKLRVCLHKQNGRNQKISINNKSGYKGVCWLTRSLKWLAYIRVDGKRHALGLYNDKKEAAKAYNKAALKYHGEFANLNRID